MLINRRTYAVCVTKVDTRSFLNACTEGSVPKITLHLEAGLTLSVIKFAFVCVSGNLEAVKLCVERAQNLEELKREDVIVTYTTQYNHIKILRYLIQEGFAMSKSALITAVDSSHISALKLLLNSGCPGLDVAVFKINSWGYGKQDVVKVLEEYKQNARV